MELEGYLRFLLALLFVVGLIVFLAWAGRRFGMTPRMGAARGSRRLSIVEVASLDAKRRLVLVRRDETEHLLLLGQGGDAVIETGIGVPPPYRADVGERAALGSRA